MKYSVRRIRLTMNELMTYERNERGKNLRPGRPTGAKIVVLNLSKGSRENHKPGGTDPPAKESCISSLILVTPVNLLLFPSIFDLPVSVLVASTNSITTFVSSSSLIFHPPNRIILLRSLLLSWVFIRMDALMFMSKHLPEWLLWSMRS